MDPITALTIGSTAVGLVTSFMGGQDKVKAAQQTADASSRIAGLETQQDQVRRQAMEVSARRQQIETVRMQQRARAQALTNATSQGASKGSGLEGGYGQISGQTGFNQLGISQNLAFGEQMFDINAQINTQKQAIAQASALSAQGTGMQSLGQGILGSTGAINNLGRQFSGTMGNTPTGNPAAQQGWGSWMSSIGGNGLV